MLELMADLLSIKPSKRPKAATVLERLRSREPELDGESASAALVHVRSRTDSTATVKAVISASPAPADLPRPALDRLAVALVVLLKSIVFAATLGSLASQLVLALGLIEVSLCVTPRSLRR